MDKTRAVPALFVCLVLAVFAFVLSAQVSEAKSGQSDANSTKVLHRGAPENPGQSGARRDFTFDLPGEDAPYCSGACNCSTCVCQGTESCCVSGCGGCWAVLDDSGACGAAS